MIKSLAIAALTFSICSPARAEVSDWSCEEQSFVVRLIAELTESKGYPAAMAFIEQDNARYEDLYHLISYTMISQKDPRSLSREALDMCNTQRQSN